MLSDHRRRFDVRQVAVSGREVGLPLRDQPLKSLVGEGRRRPRDRPARFRHLDDLTKRRPFIGCPGAARAREDPPRHV